LIPGAATRVGYRLIALFEVAKGGIVLLAGFGLLTLLHRDLRRLAEHLVGLLHLQPDGRYPHFFLELASDTTDAKLWALSGLACTYAVLRIAEGYGLWHARRWAEWLAVASGGLYMPAEVYEIVHRAPPIKLGAFLFNALVVAYMGYALWHDRRRKPRES